MVDIATYLPSGLAPSRLGQTAPDPIRAMTVPNNPGKSTGAAHSIAATLGALAHGSYPVAGFAPGAAPPAMTPGAGMAAGNLVSGDRAVLSHNGVMGMGGGYRPPTGSTPMPAGPQPLAGDIVNRIFAPAQRSTFLEYPNGRHPAHMAPAVR